VAGTLGLLLVIPLGHLADRLDPRKVAVGIPLVRAEVTVMLLATSSVVVLMPLVALIGIAE
jgi:hypothetical protein